MTWKFIHLDCTPPAHSQVQNFTSSFNAQQKLLIASQFSAMNNIFLLTP